VAITPVAERVSIKWADQMRYANFR
jgi:hypothetical protein